MADALFEGAGAGPVARLRFDPADPVLARAAWSRLAEPGDVVAGALVQALGPVDALDWLLDAVRSPERAAAALRRIGGVTVPVGVAPADAPGRIVPRSAGPAAVDGQASVHGTARERGGAAAALLAAVRRWESRAAVLDPGRDLEVLDRYDGTFLAPGDPRWPTRLADLGPGEPLALWVRGRADLRGLTERSVAVVGSRACTEYGTQVATELGSGLSDRGFTVVSGGAYGIDAAAHRGSLAAGGRTIAFLAGGVDRLYPPGNQDLLRRLTEEGAVVSEVPPGSVPGRQRFLKRNRLIAAVSGATVVVEAALRSGALSTANHATSLLRPLGSVPGPVTSMASSGCHELLRQGAAVCVTDAAEAAELAGQIGVDTAPTPVGETRPGDDLGAAERAVLDALPVRSHATVDGLARVAGLAVGETLGALGILELVGLAEQQGGRWRMRRPA